MFNESTIEALNLFGVLIFYTVINNNIKAFIIGNENY